MTFPGASFECRENPGVPWPQQLLRMPFGLRPPGPTASGRPIQPLGAPGQSHRREVARRCRAFWTGCRLGRSRVSSKEPMH